MRARGSPCTGFFLAVVVELVDVLVMVVVGRGSEDASAASLTSGIDCVRESVSSALWCGEMGKAEVLADMKLAERMR